MARQDSFQGSIPLLVLKILARRGPLHGYGLTTHIQRMSQDVLRVEEGSLYPALHRMEEGGLIRAEWATTENNRQARIYQITRKGARQLDEEESRWRTISNAIGRVLKEA
ncbi:MAG TPA: PadR family transcriptional regulator [Bryobacteraceae bacterium]|jgi:transcriptional regulator|nr:PadR family transcriptional regulator [Bryobacteraceae bacterium]